MSLACVAFLFAILTAMFNKDFYKFLFGFLAIVASTLLVIITVGNVTQ